MPTNYCVSVAAAVRSGWQEIVIGRFSESQDPGLAARVGSLAGRVTRYDDSEHSRSVGSEELSARRSRNTRRRVTRRAAGICDHQHCSSLERISRIIVLLTPRRTAAGARCAAHGTPTPAASGSVMRRMARLRIPPVVTIGLIAVGSAFLGPGVIAQDGSQRARSSLEARGIEFRDDSFLRYAASGDVEILKLFLDAGIEIESKNAQGKTALQLAAEKNQWEATALLLEHGAESLLALKALRQKSWGREVLDTLRDIVSNTGLWIALVGSWFTWLYNRRQQDLAVQKEAESQRLQLLAAIEKMIPHLGEGSARDTALSTLLKLANSNEFVIAMAELYPGRAATVACLDILDKQKQDEGSRDLARVRRALFSSLFSAAGEVGERGVIELLGERLKKEELREILNDTDPQGQTALMNAAIHNRGGNIRKLAALGAKIDVSDRGGETALHHAARYGNRNATSAILASFGSPFGVGSPGFAGSATDKTRFLNTKDRRRRTALDLARRNAHNPPDPDKRPHYRAIAERLLMEGATVPERPEWTSGEPKEVVDLLASDERLETDPTLPIREALDRCGPGEFIRIKVECEPGHFYGIWDKQGIEHFADEQTSDEWWIFVRKPE